MKHRLLITLRHSVISFASLLASIGVALGEEPLVLESADDVEVSIVEGLSGTIAVTLETSSGENLLRFLDLDRGVALKPTKGLKAITDAAVSPLHDGMVYSHSPKNGGQLGWSLMDGGLPMQLTDSSLKKSEITFGLNAGEYVFVGEMSPMSKELFGISPSSSPAIRQLTRFGERNTTPHVNPVTGVIAYSTSRNFPGWDVCLFNPATGSNTCPLGSASVSFCRPKWSPLGDRIVYSRGQGSEIDLYLYDPVAQSSERLTSLSHKEYDGAWSPDATHIVFSHNPDGSDVYNLKVMRLQDRETFLVATSKRSMRGATWTGPKFYVAPPLEAPQLPEEGSTAPSIATPQATTTPSPETLPPLVTVREAPRGRAIATVRLDGERLERTMTFKIQVGGRVFTKRTTRDAYSFSISRRASVRAAVRVDKGALFSPWSPWTKLSAATNAKRR